MYASISNRLHTIDSTQGVEVYTSKDLIHWNEPSPVYIIPDNFWAHHFVWAPEVHHFNGKYYLFVTFTSVDSLPSIPGRPYQQKRGTQVLVADKLTGPFRPFQNRSHTPTGWMALDGTLWVEDGIPYMVFCHEWVQLANGTVELARLKPDLSGLARRAQNPFQGQRCSLGNGPEDERCKGKRMPNPCYGWPFFIQDFQRKIANDLVEFWCE